ncbi:MAG TPA: TetR/AcrR family transcriptional regulator [Gaiellaceae bacterium]|nr:TetR/AcrR family transcriptional regulator [Gaiellaceae bacterium]
MTRRTPAIQRQSIGDLRRSELIDAAILTLAEKGYENTTVRDVAQAAGASPASVLYYFESTEALLAAAFERADKEFRDLVRSELAPLKGTARLERLVELCLPTPGEASPAWAIEMDLWALAARRSDFRTMFGAANDDWLSIIGEAFDQAVAAGELTEPRDLRDAVVRLAALIDGLAVYTRVTDGITAEQARRIALREVESSGT